MAVIWLPKISSLRSRGPFAVCGDSARTSALRELVRDCRGVVAVQFLFLMFPLLLPAARHLRHWPRDAHR